MDPGGGLSPSLAQRVIALLFGTPLRLLARTRWARTPTGRYPDGQRLSGLLRLVALASTWTVDQTFARPGPVGRRLIVLFSGVMAPAPPRMRETRNLRLDGSPALGARLSVPAGAGDGLLVFFHGGGWVFGSVAGHDATCRTIAAAAGVRVLSVEYRLAPEAPFPAAYDDARAAYTWAVRHAAELGVDPDRIAVGGDSAGGGLAASVAYVQALEVPRPAHCLLLYPVGDLDLARHRSAAEYARGLLLTRRGLEHAAGHLGADPADPRVALTTAPLPSDGPAATIATAGTDPLRDGGEALAAHLREGGVAVDFERVDDVLHGFATLLVADECRAATERTAARFGQALRA